MHDEQVIKQKFLVLNSVLDERSRRLWAACEAKALGWGGIAVVSQATGLSRTTISAGLRECVQQAEAAEVLSGSRMRRHDGGRKRLTRADPQLVRDLEWLVDPQLRAGIRNPRYAGPAKVPALWRANCRR